MNLDGSLRYSVDYNEASVVPLAGEEKLTANDDYASLQSLADML